MCKQFCENYFINNVSRNNQGRVIVKLPIKEDKIKLFINNVSRNDQGHITVKLPIKEDKLKLLDDTEELMK